MKGHVRKRGKKSWAVVVDLGRDANGKRRQKWVSVKGNRREAERKLTEVLRELDTGTYVEPSKLTVREYLDLWLNDHAKGQVGAKTFERYKQLIERHVVPTLGSYKLPELKPLHLQALYGKALESGRSDGKGGLAPQTVVHIHRVLRTALKKAVKWQLLARNPADAVDPPRADKPEMKALDAEDTAKLLTAASRSTLKGPILVAVTTGVRRGELLALRWSDVELDRAELVIRRALQETNDGLSFKEPKTARGRRLIALPGLTVQFMRQHKADQAKQRLRLGPLYQDHGLIFPRPDGTPWPPDAFSTAFAALIRRSDLPHIRFHDLRHSHASQLLKQGVHPKVVSERLGHSTIAITLDTYSHVLPGLQAIAASEIDQLLNIAISNQT